MRDLLACILKLGGGRKVKKDIQHHECKLQGREAINSKKGFNNGQCRAEFCCRTT